jgi:hypothetical protein
MEDNMTGNGLKNGLRDWICVNIAKANDREKFLTECQNKFGSNRRTITNAIAELRGRGRIPRDAFIPVKLSSAVVPKQNARSSFRLSVDLSEIAGEFDEEAKILKGLESLGTRLIKDNDFRVELGVPIDRWKVVSGMPKFAGNKRELKGKRFRGVYWGSTSVIRELSKKIDIL